MKKKKEIIPPIMNVESLHEYDRQHWKRIEEKRLAVQREGEKKLVKALDEQARIHKLLTKALGIVTEMEDAYITLEEKIAVEKKSAVDAASVKAEDVNAGRVTIKEFYAKGTSEAQRVKLASEQMAGELKDSRAVVREKRKEIIQLEYDLHVQRQAVFHLRTNPVTDLVKAYKDHADFLERSSQDLFEYRMGSDSAVHLKESELMLCDGKTLGAGHHWENLSLDEAHKLVLSPIFPEHLISELKLELAKPDVVAPINVTLHFGLGANLGIDNAELTVRPTPQRGEAVTTSSGVFGKLRGKREVSEEESMEEEARGLKKKIITTGDIDVSRDSKIIHKVKEE